MNRIHTFSSYKFTAILFGVALVAFASQSAEAAPEVCYEYEEVNVPNGQGGDLYTSWFSVNNSGQMVGNYCITQWCDPTADGDFVGGAFYDSNTGTFETFALPGTPDWVGTIGINDDGVVVGSALTLLGWGNWPPSDPVIFTWTPGGEVEYPPGPAGMSDYSAAGLNNHGVTVGAYDDPNVNRRRGLILDSGEYSTYDLFDILGDAAVTRTFVRDTNNRGDLAGNATVGGTLRGWVDTGSGPSYVDVPGAVSTSVNGLNQRGFYVGTYEDADAVPPFGTGFIVRGSGDFQDIAYPGAVYTDATDINNQGVIVGTTDFASWGFIARPYNCNKD
jgi:hypothetical protein